MAMNPLPPQAYTKETLAKAFAWLQTQNDSIKELASAPDILVSLYLKTKMQGENSLERPSIQNFKNELKSLAGMMGEFEVAETFPTTSTNRDPKSHSGSLFANGGNGLAHAQAHANTQTQTSIQNPPPHPLPTAATAATAAPFSTSVSGLDSRSLAMIQEVKNGLNLSSDAEALRALIALGYRGVKSLLG